MANPTQAADFDTTIAALQKDPNSIPANDAFAIIDSWQQKLQGNDIAEDLGELKQAIQNGNSAEIAKILNDLGEDTTGAAGSLPDDVSAKVKQIGSLLSEMSQKAK